MKMYLLAVTALIGITLATGRNLAAQAQDKPNSETTEASCLLKIECNPEILPLTPENVNALLAGATLGPAVAQKVLGVVPKDFASSVTVRFDSRPTLPHLRQPGMGLQGPTLRPELRNRQEPAPGPSPDDLPSLDEQDSEGPPPPAHIGVATGPGPVISHVTGGGMGPMVSMRSVTVQPPEFGEQALVTAGPLGSSSVLVGQLTVRINKPNDVKPMAEEFLRALVEKLRSTLDGLGETTKESLNHRLDAARKQLQKAQADFSQLQTMEHQLRDRAGQVDPYREVIYDRFRALEKGKQGLEMELASKRARRAAVERQIALVSQRVERQAESDPISVELEKVIKLRERQVQAAGDMEKSAGENLRGKGVLLDSMIEPIEKLTAARLQLAQRREMLAKGIGGNVLGRLNDDLVMLSIDTAELEERLALTNQQLKDMKDRKLFDLADDFESQVRPRIHAAQDTVERMTRMTEELTRRQASYLNPTVTTIGCK